MTKQKMEREIDRLKGDIAEAKDVVEDAEDERLAAVKAQEESEAETFRIQEQIRNIRTEIEYQLRNLKKLED